MAKTITITIPDVHVDRVKQMLCESLRRELTPEELRYLGLSSPIMSIKQVELRQMKRHRGEVRTRGKVLERKLA